MTSLLKKISIIIFALFISTAYAGDDDDEGTSDPDPTGAGNEELGESETRDGDVYGSDKSTMVETYGEDQVLYGEDEIEVIDTGAGHGGSHTGGPQSPSAYSYGEKGKKKGSEKKEISGRGEARAVERK